MTVGQNPPTLLDRGSNEQIPLRGTSTQGLGLDLFWTHSHITYRLSKP